MELRILQDDTMRHFTLITLAKLPIDPDWDVYALRVEHPGRTKDPTWFVLEDICVMAHPRRHLAHQYPNEEQVLAALELGREKLEIEDSKPPPEPKQKVSLNEIIEEMTKPSSFANHPGFFETIHTHDHLIIVPWFMAEAGDSINRHLAIKR